MRRILTAALVAASIGGLGGVVYAGTASVVGAHGLKVDMVQKADDRWTDCHDWDRHGRRCRDAGWDEGRMHDYWGSASCRKHDHDRYFSDGRWHECPRRHHDHDHDQH